MRSVDTLTQFCLTVQFTVLNVFFVREFAARLQSAPVIATAVNPGFCLTSLGRNNRMSLLGQLNRKIYSLAFGRTAEAGSREILWAAIGAPHRERDLHGRYVTEMEVREESEFAVSREGYEMQRRIWVGITCFVLRSMETNFSRGNRMKPRRY